MLLTSIFSFVKVPVLSVQITVVLPRVSDAGSFLTRTFFIIILLVAKASPREITAGKPSGTAATARLTATKKDCIKLKPFNINKPIIIKQRKTTAIAVFFAKVSNFFLKGFSEDLIS